VDFDPSAIKDGLIAHYDATAGERVHRALRPGRDAFRDEFIVRLHEENRSDLLELGAGTGQDARRFHAAGIRLLAIDLSPEHVAYCRRAGIDARVGDFYNLAFGDAGFDAAWAMSSLLHVPNRDLGRVLAEITRVLRPGSLIGAGFWGGIDHEGPWGPADCGGARFYALRTDDRLRTLLGEHWEIESFATTKYDPDDDVHYQWVVARSPAAPG
jgi:SAM-dependent methyltransferase